MNSRNSLEEHEVNLTFDEKVDILFHELDLAIKWSRPSILFAVYSSGIVLSKAKAELEERLAHLNQKTHIIEISGKNQSNFSTEIFQLPRISHSVLFIDDITCGGNDENTSFFKELKRNLEKFIDHRIRVIFWLSEKEVPQFATNAVECWILRHRVVEFQDDPLQTNALLQTLESTWQGVDGNDFENPSSSTAISEIINSPENVEANFFHGNLILMLGILYWRKGNSNDALRFLNVALNIAKHISHLTLQSQCQNALELVQSNLKKINHTKPETEQPALQSSWPEPGNSGNNVQPAEPPCVEEPISNEKVIGIHNLEPNERGVGMNESEQLFDLKTSTEWNELGNKFLRAGSFNDAINAFTKAIESAPDLSWPYIRNLAAAHYHKGKIKGKLANGITEEPDVWECEDDDVQPVVYFSQESISPARRGDDVTDMAGNQSAEAPSSPMREMSVPAKETVIPAETPIAVSNSRINPGKCTNSNRLEAEKFTQQQTQKFFQAEVAAPPAGFEPIPTAPRSGPQTAFDWNTLGNSYASTQDYEKAIYAYKNAIEIDPTFGQPYCNLGSVLFHTGKNEGAILILKKSLDYLESPEEKAMTWNRLGDVYRRTHDYGNATAAYQRAGQLVPDTNPVLTRARLSLMDCVAVG